jgi:phosphoribosylamine--glycine ligase
VYGAGQFADKLELDRDFGFEAMKNAGILIPEYKEFKDFSEGKKFVQESDKRLVFKPNGSMPCKLTYCSQNSEELLAYLDFVEKHFGTQIESFILQEFVDGIVVSSEFFCDGRRFVRPANHTVEVKKVMNDDLGPSTGCSGNIAWPCDDDNVIEEGIAKIEKLCVENSFVGQIDLNTVVNESGVYGLEWTPRFGYDATPTLFSLFKDDLGKFYSDLCSGQLKEVNIEEQFAGSVRVTIPPYPLETDKETQKLSPNVGIPIQEYDEENSYFYEIMLEDNRLVHSGGTGVVLCAIGTAEEADYCLDQAYEIANKLIVPDKQYRTDLKRVLPNMIEELTEYV